MEWRLTIVEALSCQLVDENIKIMGRMRKNARLTIRVLLKI